MNKQEFLRKLKADLSSLTDDELQNALKYYDEYLADAHEEEVEQEIQDYNIMQDLAEEIKEIDKPAEAENKEKNKEKSEEKNAGILKEDYTYATADNAAEKIQNNRDEYNKSGGNYVNYNHEKRRMKKSKSALAIVLLICFSPILIPLVIAGASVLFSFIMAFLSVALAFGCAAIGGLIAAGAGVFSVGYGIIQIIFMNVSEGLYAISIGLIGTGIGIILTYLFGKLTFVLFKYEFKFLGFIGKKIFKPARHGA